MEELTLGQLVVSKVGRDVGKLYVIVGFEQNRLLVADGRTRPLERPKRKNYRHLKPLPVVDQEIIKGINHGSLENADLRKLMASLPVEEKGSGR